jgi:anti-sigma factor RsiW
MRLLSRFRRSGAPGIPCQEIVELVTDYLEGALPPEQRRRVDAHLSACEHCDTYLDQMRRMLEATGRIEPESVPAELVSRLEAAFDEYNRTDGRE